MIRQAISCDICGAEKKHTNHWYVTCEQNGELRVGGWNSRMQQRPNAKHLCGQICLHKLVDEFIARASGQRHAAAEENAEAPAPRADVDSSLTSPAAYAEVESSARLIERPPASRPVANPGPSPIIPNPVAPRVAPAPRPAAAAVASSVLPMQPRLVPEPTIPKALPPQQIEDTPNYSSRRWRAEAWERERNRELHTAERHTELSRRHKGL